MKPSEIVQALVEHPAVGYGPVRSIEDARFHAICAWLDMHAATCRSESEALRRVLRPEQEAETAKP